MQSMAAECTLILGISIVHIIIYTHVHRIPVSEQHRASSLI